MSKTLENLKSGNYEVVDNQGVSVTTHFIECLEKEFFDLEEQLKNAIVPKFKIGQAVYTFNKYQDCVYTLYLISIHIEQYETTEFNNLVYRARRLEDGFVGGYLEEDLFATKEEALAKLKELQGV